MQNHWVHVPPGIKDLGLRDLALQFLRDGVDDARLNRELLELFPHRFDLCAEFKNLFVYGCSLHQSELEPGELEAILEQGKYYSKLRRFVMDLEPDYSRVTRADELP